MRDKLTETDLAKAVINTLREWGWEVYQEVEGPGGRADIVAKRGNIQWAIECKLSFGFPVIDQAYNWVSKCHYSSIAIPYNRAYTGLGRRVCTEFGIGMLKVAFFHGEDGEVEEAIKPRLNRKPRLLKLYEEQKTFCEAGSNRGGHFTSFKRTKNNLISMVQAQPGIEFKELIKSLDHHYSSLSTAKSCLRNFIGTDVIPELRVETVGGKLCIFTA